MPQAGGPGERRRAVDRGRCTSCSRTAPLTSGNRPPRARPPSASSRALDAGGHGALPVVAPRRRTGAARRAAPPRSNRSRPRSARCCCSGCTSGGRRADAHSAGAEFAVLPGARRRRQIQPAADGGAGRARPRVPRGGAHPAFSARRSTSGTSRELAARGVEPRPASGGVVAFERTGVDVHVVTKRQPARLFLGRRSRTSARTSS